MTLAALDRWEHRLEYGSIAEAHLCTRTQRGGCVAACEGQTMICVQCCQFFFLAFAVCDVLITVCLVSLCCYKTQVLASICTHSCTHKRYSSALKRD